jgi:hypothetical protein
MLRLRVFLGAACGMLKKKTKKRKKEREKKKTKKNASISDCKSSM